MGQAARNDEAMMRFRCAIYARYSSDQQSPASIDDQIRKCREYAQRQGWSVIEEHLYTDAEASAAGTDRPGLQRLLGSTQRRPRAWDVLLIDDTSRLSRRQADQANITDQLGFAGFRLVAVSQGIDTASEQADVLMTVHSLVDSLYIKELAKKTHRGLEGRVLSGQHAGGRCFGYRNEHGGGGGVRLVVNEAEAAIVRRIFEACASGLSLKSIARTLNAEAIASPRRSNGSGPATWGPTAIRGMLRNELYIGRVIWNRRKWVKRPGTNRRVPRERPRSEWRIVDHPELRIISADLWQRVRDHQQLVTEVYGRAGTGINKASSSAYLLTGFLKCGLCRSNLIIVAGKGRKTIRKYYGCSQHFHRGACDNGLTIRQDVVERNYFSRLQSEVVTPEVVSYTIRDFTRRIRERDGTRPEEIAALRARQIEIDRELARLAEAVAHMGHSTALLNTIRDRETELGRITAQIDAMSVRGVERLPVNVAEFVTGRLKKLAGLLNSDIARARAELAKYEREIRMMPMKDADGNGYYMARGAWNLLGGVELGGFNSALVAGGGFEPPTCGL